MHERPQSILAFARLARAAILSLLLPLLATTAAGNLMRLCEPCATLGAQESTALGGPQPRDERVLVRALGKADRRRPLHRATVLETFDGHRALAVAAIPREDHEILAGKDVGAGGGQL